MRKVIVALLLAVSACDPGEMGPPGPPGPPGKDGDPGIGLVSQTICSGVLTFSNNTRVVAAHYRYTFADGSALITCEIYPDNGPVHRKDSAPHFYRSTDVDFTTGRCVIAHSVTSSDGNSPSAMFEFSAVSDATIGQATYRDLENSQYDGVAVPLACQSPY